MGTPVEPLDRCFRDVFDPEDMPVTGENHAVLRASLGTAKKALIELRDHAIRSLAQLEAMEKDLADHVS